MSHAKGRKARDDRYYQANKDEINRRRRERRLRERQKQAPGNSMLKLVENPPVDALAVSDLQPASDQSQASDQPALDHGSSSRAYP
jgi:hypothetical protein